MSEHLPKVHYLDPEILQKPGDLELIAREAVEGLRVGSHIDHTIVDTSRPLDAVLSEFFFRRQATLHGPSAGTRG